MDRADPAAQNGSDRIFVVTNNHYRGQALANALQIKNMVTGEKLDSPELLKQYPVLEDIVSKIQKGQRDLFEDGGETPPKDDSMQWWENESFRVRDGRLFIAGHPAEELARRHGTPLYVYGRKRILANVGRLKKAFAGASRPVRFCYAMKANPHPGILGALRAAGAWIDAVSPAEVAAALAAGYPSSKVLFTGTSLNESDLRAAFAVEGLVVNIDAFEQIELMARVRGNWFRGRKIPVSVRWNPGIGRGFNPKAVTAGKRNSAGTPIKFGVEESKVVPAFRAAAAAGFTPVGLHQHLGSGWVAEDYPAVAEAVDRMAAKAAEIEAAGFRLSFLDFGGGFGPQYSEEQRLFPLDRYAEHIDRAVRKAKLRVPALFIEPGKFLVADAGARAPPRFLHQALIRKHLRLRRRGDPTTPCRVRPSTPRRIITSSTFPGWARVRRRRSRSPAISAKRAMSSERKCRWRSRSPAMSSPSSARARTTRSMASGFNLRPIPAELLL